MPKSPGLTNTPMQRLPRDAYVSEEWFIREQQDLLGRTWAFAGVVTDFKEAGDFRTVQAGSNALIVIKGQDASCAAFTTSAGIVEQNWWKAAEM